MTADLVALARRQGATVVESQGATVIVVAAPTRLPDRLSVAEAAKVACCTRRRVREAIRAGELPASELGERSVSLRREDVVSWIESHPARVRAPVAEGEADDLEIERRLRAKSGSMSRDEVSAIRLRNARKCRLGPKKGALEPPADANEVTPGNPAEEGGDP